jgi:hypothetical protein
VLRANEIFRNPPDLAQKNIAPLQDIVHCTRTPKLASEIFVVAQHREQALRCGHHADRMIPKVNVRTRHGAGQRSVVGAPAHSRARRLDPHLKVGGGGVDQMHRAGVVLHLNRVIYNFHRPIDRREPRLVPSVVIASRGQRRPNLRHVLHGLYKKNRFSQNWVERSCHWLIRAL